MEAQSPDKFMDVTSDVKMTDENDFLSRSMMNQRRSEPGSIASLNEDHLLLEGRPVRILGGTSTEGFGE